MGLRGVEIGWAGAGLTIFMSLQTNRQFGEPKQDWPVDPGLAGQARPLITGQETLSELRQLIIDYSQASPANQMFQTGPFHIMGTLSLASLTTLVNSLSREACLDLFKMEQNCRAQATDPRTSKAHEK